MDDLFYHPESEMISYIRARDPSIQALNRPRHYENPTNLLPLFNEESRQEDNTDENDGRLQVYLRFKKANNIEQYYDIQDDSTLLCKIPKDAQCVRNVQNEKVTKKFTFTRIFPPDAKQVDVFNGVVKEKVLRFINGQNCSLFTYGASGSGKTFTILGTDHEPGIIPRALEYLFRTLPPLLDEISMKPMHPGGFIRLNSSTFKFEREACQQIINSVSEKRLHFEIYRAMQRRLSNESGAVIDEGDDVKVGIWVTFAEIYNESIYDLLVPQPPKGKPRQRLQLGTVRGNTFIKNLKPINITTGLEAYMVLQYGQQNLQYAETQLNSHSSRSHCIFTIKLVQDSERENGTSVSQFHFCDLAGSERVKKTLNIGDRLKESNNINNSLLVLGRCISLVRKIQRNNNCNDVVPFRESKLTQLFQNALSGHEPIAMIVNLNPSRDMFDEGLHVLNFSAIAKDILVEKVTSAQSNQRRSRFSDYLQSQGAPRNRDSYNIEEEELRSIIRQLQAEIENNEEEHRRDRERIIAGYQNILENTKKFHERHIENINKLAENNKNLLKEQIEFLKSELKRANSSKVIDLTIDEDPENYQANETENVKIMQLMQEINQYEEELVNKEAEIECLTKKLELTCDKKESLEKEVIELRQEVIQLKNTLVDAKNDYQDLEKTIEEYQQKDAKQVALIVELEEKNSQLHAALRNNICDSEPTDSNESS